MNSKAKRATKAGASRPKQAKRSAADSRTREEMIAEAAYFRAARRNFDGDDCLGDWLQAEQEIDELLRRQSTEDSK